VLLKENAALLGSVYKSGIINKKPVRVYRGLL